MAKPSTFAHVVYMTRRFDEMIAWYQKVFEATVVHRDPVLAFLACDDEHHRFAFENLSALKPTSVGAEERGEVGVNHVAHTYANVGDLLETYARLKEAGITPYWPVHHGVTLSLYYRDPDGNRMEFQVDCCTVEEANAFMRPDASATNPIGAAIDPEALLAQYRNGAPLETLLARPKRPVSLMPREHGLS
jgi:catechol 2,3-dioxygenase-like lactoylglutathione lyase family enzyme